ncbi:MAG: metallophosphoesterase family protein [Planctomycetota bacterium]
MASLLVALVSDTHGLVRPELLDAVAGCDAIVHAGDIGGAEVLAALRAHAPVHAIRGNNDVGTWAADVPHAVTIELAGRRVHVVHDAHDFPASAGGERVDVLVTGHTHRPLVRERDDGVLHVNPGSAGPRRFTLPVTVARLTIDADGARAEIFEIVRRG